MGRRKQDPNRRKRLLARYGHLYVQFKPPGYWRPDACVYCGNIAQSKDHIPPLAWMECLGFNYFDKLGLLVVWVPSCLECNGLLGDAKLFSIRERTVHLIGRYEERYKAFRSGIAWEDHEIEELCGRLKVEISQFGTIQHAIDRRISILEENARVR